MAGRGNGFKEKFGPENENTSSATDDESKLVIEWTYDEENGVRRVNSPSSNGASSQDSENGACAGSATGERPYNEIKRAFQAFCATRNYQYFLNHGVWPPSNLNSPSELEVGVGPFNGNTSSPTAEESDNKNTHASQAFFFPPSYFEKRSAWPTGNRKSTSRLTVCIDSSRRTSKSDPPSSNVASSQAAERGAFASDSNQFMKWAFDEEYAKSKRVDSPSSNAASSQAEEKEACAGGSKQAKTCAFGEDLSRSRNNVNSSSSNVAGSKAEEKGAAAGGSSQFMKWAFDEGYAKKKKVDSPSSNAASFQAGERKACAGVSKQMKKEAFDEGYFGKLRIHSPSPNVASSLAEEEGACAALPDRSSHREHLPDQNRQPYTGRKDFPVQKTQPHPESDVLPHPSKRAVLGRLNFFCESGESSDSETLSNGSRSSSLSPDSEVSAVFERAAKSISSSSLNVPDSPIGKPKNGSNPDNYKPFANEEEPEKFKDPQPSLDEERGACGGVLWEKIQLVQFYNDWAQAQHAVRAGNPRSEYGGSSTIFDKEQGALSSSIQIDWGQRQDSAPSDDLGAVGGRPSGWTTNAQQPETPQPCIPLVCYPQRQRDLTEGQPKTWAPTNEQGACARSPELYSLFGGPDIFPPREILFSSTAAARESTQGASRISSGARSQELITSQNIERLREFIPRRFWSFIPNDVIQRLFGQQDTQPAETGPENLSYHIQNSVQQNFASSALQMNPHLSRRVLLTWRDATAALNRDVQAFHELISHLVDIGQTSLDAALQFEVILDGILSRYIHALCGDNLGLGTGPSVLQTVLKSKMMAKGSRSHGVKTPFVFAFGDFGLGKYRFAEPGGQVYLPDGSYIICDTNNHRLVEYDAWHIFKRTIGQHPEVEAFRQGGQEGDLIRKRGLVEAHGYCFYPNRVAYSKVNNYIVITERPPSNNLKIFSYEGQYLHSFGGKAVEHPRGVTVDSNGLIFVVESQIKRLAIFRPSGRRIARYTLVPYVEFPNSIAVHEGKILISDNTQHKVFVFSYHGFPLYTIGSEGRLQYPVDVSVNFENQVVITDNHISLKASVYTMRGCCIYTQSLSSPYGLTRCQSVSIHPYQKLLMATTEDNKVFFFDYNQQFES